MFPRKKEKTFHVLADPFDFSVFQAPLNKHPQGGANPSRRKTPLEKLKGTIGIEAKPSSSSSSSLREIPLQQASDSIISDAPGPRTVETGSTSRPALQSMAPNVQGTTITSIRLEKGTLVASRAINDAYLDPTKGLAVDKSSKDVQSELIKKMKRYHDLNNSLIQTNAQEQNKLKNMRNQLQQQVSEAMHFKQVR